MKDNKAIAQDLGIELAGASIVALIVWLATLTSGTVGIPTPAVILIAGLATLAVAFLVSNVVRGRHVRRVETEMRGMREASRYDRERFRRIRDEIRTIGEQLMVGDQQTTLKAITTYTVDPAGQDRIESAWVVAYREDHHGRVFTTDDWSSEPPTGEVTCHCQTDDGTSVSEMLVVDEPTNKQYVLFLHPPVGKTQRTLQVRQTWPGLWNDLRANGRDYVELSARTGLQSAVTQVHIPASVGRFKWVPSANATVRPSETTVGTQQTLTFAVDAPQAGTKYRADLIRA